MPDTLRTSIAAELSDNPADALARYFALEHDPRRVKLFARQNARGKVLAFVAVCQTGIDLFRPLVVMRGDDSNALRDVLREALALNRQYIFSIPPALRPDLSAVAMLNDDALNRTYALSAEAFVPVMNLLAQNSQTPDGLARSVIWGKDNVLAAEAGASWMSAKYAEVYVRVELSVRSRGLGKSVVSSLSQQLLALRRTPLYMTSVDNVPSQKLAERLGYRDTGALEISGNMVRRG